MSNHLFNVYHAAKLLQGNVILIKKDNDKNDKNICDRYNSVFAHLNCHGAGEFKAAVLPGKYYSSKKIVKIQSVEPLLPVSFCDKTVAMTTKKII